jgi:hypothetical protein
MRVTLAVMLLCACTVRGSGKSATPDFKRYSKEVALRIEVGADAGSSDVVSASITEVSTILGLKDCLLNLWWSSGGTAEVRVADASTGSRALTIEKLEDASTGSASFKSQNNLDSYACKRPITVIQSAGEVQLVR